ncbi:MAG TPA: hypothetical protein VFI63_03875 [Solirubrobacterales bacterium]|nr:hypothetical protein [Solirubrobacterales bacterium]
MDLAELSIRVDEALATARASEAAIMTVSAAAFDAAEQARRAAELAERASAALLAGRARGADDCLRNFTARADRVAARLRALECAPIRIRRTSDAATPQPAAG